MVVAIPPLKLVVPASFTRHSDVVVQVTNVQNVGGGGGGGNSDDKSFPLDGKFSGGSGGKEAISTSLSTSFFSKGGGIWKSIADILCSDSEKLGGGGVALFDSLSLCSSFNFSECKVPAIDTLRLAT